MLDAGALNWVFGVHWIRGVHSVQSETTSYERKRRYAFSVHEIRQLMCTGQINSRSDNHYCMEFYERKYPVAFALESILQGFWLVAGTTCAVLLA